MALIRDLLKQLGVGQPAALHDAGDPSGQRVPNPVLSTLSNSDRAAITRPRRVLPTDQAIAAATPRMRDMLAKQQPLVANTVPNVTPTPMREMQQPFDLPPDTTPFGSSGEPFQADRPRRTQMRDFIADDAQYLRDLEAQPRNWKDKTVDAVRGLNQHFNPNSGQGMPTKREREIIRAQGGLARSMAMEKQQTDAALKGLVPVQLEDGTVVMSPARTAGTLASQQQGIRRGNETLTARKARWKQMGEHERVQDALRVYNSGGANDPETLKAISETLKLPATLQAKFNAGEVVPQVDNNGKLQLVNKRDGSVVDTGVTSYETTKEAGRNTRQERQATAAMARTEALIKAGIGKLGDPNVTETTAAELEDQAEEAEDLAAELTEKGFPSQGAKAAERATKLRTTITTLREAANKARTAQGVVGTQSGSQYAGRKISKSKIPEFAKRHKMSEAEATKFLTDSKAIIY